MTAAKQQRNHKDLLTTRVSWPQAGTYELMLNVSKCGILI